MRRFWDLASVVREGDRFAVRLDGKPMRLPGGPLLLLESEALAAAIAAEWQAAGGQKGGVLQVDDVPLTRLAGTGQEIVAPNPAPTIAALARYAESDLLCYRAAGPDLLVARQAALWQPWLDYAVRVYGAELRVASGVMPVVQPAPAVASLRAALAARTAFELAALGVLVPATGSVVLCLAIADGALDAQQATQLALLDEAFQAEQWGEDAQAAARRMNLSREIETTATFLRLSTPPGR